jgi:hypothetical protein
MENKPYWTKVQYTEFFLFGTKPKHGMQPHNTYPRNRNANVVSGWMRK